MTNHAPHTPDRSRQIAAYLDGTLDPSEMPEFSAWLNADDEHARRLVEQMLLESHLRQTAPVVVASPKPRGAAQRTPGGYRLTPITTALAAALLLSAAVVAIYVFVINPQPEIRDPNSAPPVATLIETTGGKLTTPHDYPSEGRQYAAGEYTLSSGTAEFMLTNSVNVKLRGATRMVVHDPMQVSLTRGTVEFVVPTAARGFTVRLPDESKIVDLGTAFRVEVTDDGQAQIRVTEGSVAWTGTAADAEPIELVAGQTARLVDGRPTVTGTLIASFNFGARANPITGVSGPSGPFNTDGPTMPGPDADVAWTNLPANKGTAVASGGGVTFRFALAGEVYQQESPGGFELGDLRAAAWRLLGTDHGITDNDVTWELAGLTPGAPYDLIFYGGDPERPNLQRIDNPSGTAEPDTEGDLYVTAVVADPKGVITGTWLQPRGQAITNWSGLQVQTHTSPITREPIEPTRTQDRRVVGEKHENE